MKFVEPKIKALEEATFEEMIASDVYYDKKISVLPDKDTVIENVTIDGCCFEKVDLDCVHFKNVDFWDTIFDGCSLSNKDFIDRSFNRCVFHNCKLVGSTFENCSFDNVKFVDCHLKYSSFFRVKVRNIIFESCCLDEARFYEIREARDICFLDSSMNSSEIIKCFFTNVDFSSDDIYGIKTDFTSIKTNIFSVEQALMLTGLLGIRIKDNDY